MMKKAHRNKLLFGAFTSVLLSLLLLAMMDGNRLSTLHLKFSNFLYQVDENMASEDIVIVAIDDKSFGISNASELGTLTFSKSDYARVIENLEAQGVSAIGVDIIFSERSDEKDQLKLVDTLRKYENVILAAEPKNPFTTGLKPLAPFVEAQPKNLGAILFEPDKDNVIRRQILFHEDEQSPNAFALQIVKRYLNLLEEDSSLTEEGYRLMDFSVRVGNKKYSPINIPLDNKRFMINFFGKAKSFQTISFADVYENEFEGLDLKNKIVLIGEFGTGLHDEQYVPLSFGEAMPGVEIHANTIQTILSQRFIQNQSYSSRVVTLILSVVISMALFLMLGVTWSLIAFILLVLSYTLATWVAFEYGFILNTVYPQLAFLISFVISYIYRYFTESLAHSKTERAFGLYVNEDVVKQIMEDPDHLKLGGQQKTLTVMFTDIADFTTISEAMTPPALVKHLNEYLDRMSGIILKHNGTLDKFVGDAILSFWGAPAEQPKHAERACTTALEYMEELEKLNAEWKKLKKPIFKARIGIHTGKMIVGNVGSSKRFDYTVIGDSVNIGARLEGKNKEFGTSILISEDTYKIVKDKFEVREIGLISVKGKKKQIRVYELLSKINKD